MLQGLGSNSTTTGFMTFSNNNPLRKTILRRSKTWQYLKHTKRINIKKGITKNCENTMFLTKRLNHNNNKHKIKHKHACQSRESNLGHLAPKADALPLDHRVN